MIALAIAVAAVCALLACSSLLGLTDPAPYDDGGAVDTDSASGDDASADSSPDNYVYDAGSKECDAAFSRDPKNCGFCGHDCLGGGCEAGACLPVRLIAEDAAFGPRELAAAEGQVYWAEDVEALSNGQRHVAIRTCTSSNCQATSATLTTDYTKGQLHLSGTPANVYWQGINSFSKVGVKSCPALGCGGSPANIAPGWVTDGGYSESFALVPDASILYWAREGNPDASVFGIEIRQCTMPSCGDPTSVVVPASGPGYHGDIVANGDGLYWTDLFNVYARTLDGGIGKIAANQTDVDSYDLAAGPTALVWRTGNNRQLVKCDTPACSGGASSVLIQATGDIMMYAVDGANVYWSEAGVGIRTCPLASCSVHVRTLVPDSFANAYVGSSLGVAVDSKRVYWTTGLYGESIYGLAK